MNLIFTVLLALTTFQIHAMELHLPLAGIKEKGCVVLYNKTNRNLIAQYQYENGSVVGVALATDTFVVLPKAQMLASLQVTSNEKHENITPWQNPENIVSKIPLYTEAHPHCCINITSKSSQGLLSSKQIFESSTQPMCELEFVALTAIPYTNCLSDAFPNARSSLNRKELPFPRLFLDLPSQSHLKEDQASSLEATYERLIVHWSAFRNRHPLFVTEVFLILSQAYELIRNELDLKRNSLIQKYLSKTPISLKERVKGTVSDEILEKILSDLCAEWKKILGSADESLYNRVRLHLAAEKEFLDLQYKLTVPIAIDARLSHQPQTPPLKNQVISTIKHPIVLTKEQEDLVAFMLDSPVKKEDDGTD